MDNKQKVNRELILREKLALQRTRLANQTTLLSFIRTSLYFLVAGLSIRSLLKMEDSLVLEFTFFIVGFVIMFIGVINYFRQMATIKASEKNVGNYKDEFINGDDD